MAINTWYRCISPENLTQLMQASRLHPEAPAEYLDSGFNDDSNEMKRPEPRLWTERNWLGLHSLLTFGEWAQYPLLGTSISGGTPIGGDYCYYGPVRYFTEEEVRNIASALEKVEEATLRSSFDPDALNAAGVPPAHAWHPEDFPHLWKTFQDIQTFFRVAQSQGYALLVYLG
ncbi:MAG: YfbM family protein [Armatimonas sp.]